MTFPQRKLLVLSAWVATIATVGLMVTIDTPDRWLLVAAIAMIPAGIANWLWDQPEPTLSELIARSRAKARS